jgi:hypothetical protein
MSCNSRGSTLTLADVPPLVRASTILLVIVASACGGDKGSRTISPVAPAPAQKVFTRIQGYVQDGAFRGVPGVRVEVVDGAQPATTGTDANGRYSFSGTFVGRVTLRATKEGYVAATRTVDLQQVCCPDPRDQSPSADVYFRLESVMPPLRIEPGNYALTLIADSTCADLPPDLRTRTYAATVQPSRDHPPLYSVNVSGPSSASGSFGLGVDGDYLGFDAAFFERLPSFTYLEIAGTASGAQSSTAGSIVIPFSGNFQYCALRSEMGLFSNCNTTPPEQRLAYAQCLSNNDLMILKRQ